MATKKTTTKKISTKKATAKKAGTSKASTKRTASSKQTARKPSAKKSAATKTPATKKATAKRSASPSGLNLAAKVLADAGEPLGSKEIAKRVIAAGWTTKGKTPHATLYAAMSREITVKGSASRFAKAGRGLFKATGKAGQ
jgi:hypothetical protein